MFALLPFRRRVQRNLILFSAMLGLLSTAAAQNPPAASQSQAQSGQQSQSQSQSQSQPQTSTGSDSSLAGAARDAKAQKAGRAKKVFTDEDMEAVAGPLPRLKLDGLENAEEVVAAIAKYKADHTKEEVESAVHIWYDRYDGMLEAAIRQNLDVTVVRNANYSNGYELCQESQDYQQCNSRQMAELRGARSDQLEMAKNNNVVTRIQHAFMSVRNGLQMSGLRYDWFKIRTTNGIDTY
jgi:hypothetical protein